MNKTLQTIFIATSILTITFGILVLSIKHDEKVMIVAEKYEKCVQTEMHTTVMAYYDQHGEYPECSK